MISKEKPQGDPSRGYTLAGTGNVSETVFGGQYVCYEPISDVPAKVEHVLWISDNWRNMQGQSIDEVSKWMCMSNGAVESGKWWLQRARSRLAQGRVVEEECTYQTCLAEAERVVKYCRCNSCVHNPYLTLLRVMGQLHSVILGAFHLVQGGLDLSLGRTFCLGVASCCSFNNKPC